MVVVLCCIVIDEGGRASYILPLLITRRFCQGVREWRFGSTAGLIQKAKSHAIANGMFASV